MKAGSGGTYPVEMEMLRGFGQSSLYNKEAYANVIYPEGDSGRTDCPL